MMERASTMPRAVLGGVGFRLLCTPGGRGSRERNELWQSAMADILKWFL